MSKKAWFILLTIIVIVGYGGYSIHEHRVESANAALPGGGRGGAGHGAGGAGRGGRGGGGAGGAEPPVPVVAGAVEKRDVSIFLDGIGTVQAFNTVTVRARVDGELEKVAFTEGQDVKAGDLLAQIDARPYQAQLDQATAKKAQDEAQLANGRAVAKRNDELLTKKVLDQQTYDTQKYAVDQLVATVQGDQAAVDNAKTQLDYTRITAPIDGRIGVRQVDQGNIIRASDAGGLVVITQLHPISVIFTLPEQNFQLIRDHYPDDPEKNPMAVFAVGRDNAGQLGQGALAVIDNQIDQTTGTIKLKATFQNEDLRLWPGQFINARLLLTVRKDGLVVPAAVIQRGPQGSFAFVIKTDSTVEARPVKIAQSEDSFALVDEGLQLGEKVVVDGQYKLQEGSKVEIANRDGPAPDNGQHKDGPRHGARQAAGDDAKPAAAVASRR